MTTFEKKSMLKSNTLLWLAAMILPGILSMVLANTKFPWQVMVPLLLFGPMLASNKMLSKAIGDMTDAAGK